MMASRSKVGDHVQLSLAAALSTALVFFILKYGLRRAGRPDLANDF